MQTEYQSAQLTLHSTIYQIALERDQIKKKLGFERLERIQDYKNNKYKLFLFSTFLQTPR